MQLTERKYLVWILIAYIATIQLAVYAANVTTQSNWKYNSSVSRTSFDDSSGAFELIPAVAGKRICVHSITITGFSGVTTMEFLTGTRTLTNPLSMIAYDKDTQSGTTGQSNGVPWLVGDTGANINVSLNGALRVTGQVIWTAELP